VRAGILRAAAAVALAGAAVALSAAAARGGSDTDGALAYQLNVGHTGVEPNSALVPPLIKQRWQVTLPAQPSYAVIANGIVYVTVGDNSSPTKRLFALDRLDGRVLWSQPLFGARPWSALA
jgi:outer membrane protein assembly factor BamB